MARIQGFTVINDKFETLINKEIVKQDVLTEIYIDRRSCDWDLDLGTDIHNKIFQYKTESAKYDIIEDIRRVIEKNPFLELIDIQTTELEKGWNFSVIISYLGSEPEQWDIPITEDSVQEYISNGTYPLQEG
jgi:hypothetical protein